MSCNYAAAEPTGGVVPIELALGLAGLGLLILVNALFVAAELSLVAVDRDRVDALAAQGSRPARMVSRSLGRLSLTLSGTQLGVTVLSLVLGIVAEPTVAGALHPLVRPLPTRTSTACRCSSPSSWWRR